MHLSIKTLILAGIFSSVALAMDESKTEPWKSSAWGVESGVLWEAGHSTPFAYRMLQTQLSWRSPEVFGRELPGGSHLTVRHRLTLIAMAIQNGPESHYIAFSGSPSVEWWKFSSLTQTSFSSFGLTST